MKHPSQKNLDFAQLQISLLELANADLRKENEELNEKAQKRQRLAAVAIGILAGVFASHMTIMLA